VAVLDTGINPGHPDLAGNVNMALAASFVPGEDVDVRPLPPAPRPFSHSHGTHVAGIIAARDNALGILGVAPEAEIVPIKVLSQFNGCGTWEQVIAGIVYAADIGADVINMSIVGLLNRSHGIDDNCTLDPSDDVPLTAAEVQAIVTALERAVQYAHARGAVIVAAAGNQAIDGDHDRDQIILPAALPHVISVSATAPHGWAHDPATDLDVLASYSNHGQSDIDFAAPGGNRDLEVTGTCKVGPSPFLPCSTFDLVVSTAAEGYAFAAGTSMAAPHVSGVAALIVGDNGGDMLPADVERVLRRYADDLGKPGQDDAFGHGRVNAGAAVR
jgi:subtilisin family serine protease